MTHNTCCILLLSFSVTIYSHSFCGLLSFFNVSSLLLTCLVFTVVVSNTFRIHSYAHVCTALLYNTYCFKSSGAGLLMCFVLSRGSFGHGHVVYAYACDVTA
jgi:hypothetical protein